MPEDNFLFIIKENNGYSIARTTKEQALENFNAFKDNDFGYKCYVAKIINYSDGKSKNEQKEKPKTKKLLDI